MSLERPPVIWRPQPGEAAECALGRFAKQLGFELHEYDALWRWSIADPAAYWAEVWKFGGLKGDLGDLPVSAPNDMAGVRFFDRGTVNVAENLLAAAGERVAVIEADPQGECRRWTYAELRKEVEAVGGWLRRNGVGPGDVVAAVLPNRFEALVSFLASSAVGASWTSCAPEFSPEATLDRIGQVSPKVLFVCHGYKYNGRNYPFKHTADLIASSLQSLKAVVVVDRGTEMPLAPDANGGPPSLSYGEVAQSQEQFEWRRFPFNSPALVLYTSGTTGKPKAIVHSGGGMLLKLTGEHAFHMGVSPDDVVFWYSSTGWMMFHWLAFTLVRGSAVVLYEDAAIPKGHEGPDVGALWRIADRAGVTIMGLSPSYMAAVADAGYSPKKHHDMSRLRTILAAGSVVSAEQFEWVQAHVSANARFNSMSGGTELMSAFVAGSPLHEVRAGEISCKCLGMAVAVFDERGVSVVGRKGELVCTEPFPSMPLTFWGGDGDQRYRAAYFTQFPKVWTHGDLAEETLSGGIVIYGRSDTTLNPGGVRIGTAEIYRPLAEVSAIEAAVVFGRPVKNSEEIVLCVKLTNGRQLDAGLAADIRDAVRRKASPRHVPHAIYQVDAVPLTQNGKPVEAAAKAAATSRDVSRFSAISNPECLVQFANLGSRPAL